MAYLSEARARAIISRFGQAPPVVVIGDVMLDQFIVGRVTRISPEAPVPVVAHDHDEFRAGGAANVARNIRALGGSVELVGLVGADPQADRLRGELERDGVGTAGLVEDPGRPTTTKARVVTERRQQVTRVDYERDDEAAGPAGEALTSRAERLAEHAAVIVVSDYLKGVVTKGLMARLVRAARMGSRPLLVDPKIPHLSYYGGASLVTPNHHEAEHATHSRIRSDADAAAAAADFRARAACDHVLITRGEHGMCLLEGSTTLHLPAVAREVADVTGAGDTVVGTVALALAAGASLAEASALANHAAGIAVGKFGAATVAVAELIAAVADRDR